MSSTPDEANASNTTDHSNIVINNRSSEGSSKAEARLLTQGQASVLILIINSETRACSTNLAKIKQLFADPYFSVQVCTVAEPKEFPEHRTLTRNQYLENYTMRKILTYAAEGPYEVGEEDLITPQQWWTNLPVIIIKDSTISHISTEHITRHIATALQRAPTADLFFLCRWQDACHKYREVEGTSLRWSTKPTATQAIMYTPHGRDYIHDALLTSALPFGALLNQTVAQKKLSATVFVPNLVDFDIDLATSNEDFNKLNACLAVAETNTSVNWSNIAWFIVVLIAMILVAWLLIVR